MKTFAALLFSSIVLSPLTYADGNWYGLASIGQSKFQTNRNDISSQLVQGGTVAIGSSQLDATDTGFKAQVGYQINPNFAIEGGFVDLGQLHYKARVSDGMEALAGFSSAASASVRAVGLNIDALGILPVGAGFSLFLKAGVIAARIESKVAVDDWNISDNSTTNNFKPTFGVGSEYAMNETWLLRVEYERFSKLGDKNKTGEADVDLASIGLKATF